MSARQITAWIVRRLGVASMIVVLVLALVPTVAFAADTRTGNEVVVGPGETITDDLYIGGGNVAVLGTIQGDLVVFAGTVTVSGPVGGDVISVGGTTTVQGPVGRNVRVAGGNITVSNTVAQDVVVAGGNFTLEPQARVGRDLLAGTGTAVVDGAVARNVIVGSGDATLNGPVGGNVRFDGATLRLTNQTSIGGNLTYASDNALIGPVTGVKGQVRELPRVTPMLQPTPAERLTAGIIGWGRALVGLFALGLVLIFLFPAFSRRTVATLGESPLASVGVGLAAFIVTPIVAVLIFAIGLLVGGWWLGLMMLAVYGMALVMGITTVALYVGTWIFDRAERTGIHQAWALLVGVAVLLLAGLLPIIGGLITFLAILFGLGSLLLAGYRVHEEPAKVQAPSEAPPAGPQLPAAA